MLVDDYNFPLDLYRYIISRYLISNKFNILQDTHIRIYALFSYCQMMQHPLNVLNLNYSKNHFLKSVLRNWYCINYDFHPFYDRNIPFECIR